jgi:hypothetical protein
VYEFKRQPYTEVLENRVIKRMFVRKREEATGGREKLQKNFASIVL